MKKIYIICIILIFPFIFSSCWDYRDIDKRSVTTSTYADYRNGKYNLGAEIAELKPSKSSSGNNGGNSMAVTLVNASGDTLENTRENLDRKLSYPLFLGATQITVIGKGLAEEGIEVYMNRIKKIYDFRKTTLIAISREKPEEIMKLKPKNDISPGLMVEHCIRSLNTTEGFMYKDAGSIISDINVKTIGYIIPYIGIEGQDIKFLGYAVMKDSTFKGALTGDDIYGVTYMLSRDPIIPQVLKHPDNPENLITLRTNLDNKKIKTRYEHNKIIIDVNLKISAILIYENYIQPINDDTLNKLQSDLSEKIKSQVMSSISKSKDEFGIDIFEFAKYFRAQNRTQYDKINWKEEYAKNAEVNVNVSAKIKSVGSEDINAKPKEK